MNRAEVARWMTGVAVLAALGMAGVLAPPLSGREGLAPQPAAAAQAAGEPGTLGQAAPDVAVALGGSGVDLLHASAPDPAGGEETPGDPGDGGQAPAEASGPETGEEAPAGSDQAEAPQRQAVAAAQTVPGYEPMPVERVEPLLPDQPADLPDHWRGLHEVVRAVAAAYPGRISVVAVDLSSGSRYEFRARDPYLPASTFKLPVALCTLAAIERGELAWETPVTYTEADWEPVGAGHFAGEAFGTRWSVRHLVDRALISSNNVAAKMLARTLTWEGLLACTTEMGGPVTRTEDGSTPVSAADQAAWWERLWALSRERPELAEELLRPLRNATYRGRIQAGTPRPELVTHKYGTYAGYDHDGAIVWAARPYLLVVMTYGGGPDAADRAIERIAAAAWDAAMGIGQEE